MLQTVSKQFKIKLIIMMIVTFQRGGIWEPLGLAACCLLNHLGLNFHIQFDLMVA